MHDLTKLDPMRRDGGMIFKPKFYQVTTSAGIRLGLMTRCLVRRLMADNPSLSLVLVPVKAGGAE